MLGGIEYLRGGTLRQRQAYSTLSELRVFDVLAEYRPTLPGTVPIDLDVESSDLDIVCEAYDLDGVERDVSLAYGDFPGFEFHRTELRNPAFSSWQVKTRECLFTRCESRG